MQYHGYPPPPPPHPSQFHDNRYLDAPGGYFHNNDQHQHYGGGGGGQKKRVEKKKHKNNQQPQHQQQHNTQRDSYGSSTSGTTGSKNNESEGHHNNFQRRGSSPTPPIGEHHRGGSGGDKFKKSGSGEQHSQYRRDNSNSSPSGFNNRSYNRQKQQHQHSDRSSSSDAIPSTSSNSQQRRQSKADENKEIFTSSDFPGLGGGEADEQQLQSSDKKPNSNLVGYASALLKKKDVPKAEESKSNVGKSTASTSPSKSAPSPTMKKAENQSHETDDIGQEIQAGLQELSLVGNDGNVHADSKQRELSHGHDNDANETDVCRTSTCAAGLGSEQTDANNSVSNSPARPDSGGMDAKHELKPTSESLSTISLPVIDVFNSDEFPAREAPNETGNVASRGTLPPTEIAAQPSEVPNDPHSTHRDEKPKPTGAWGSKRLFADVSLFSAAFLTNLILLSQLTPTPL